MIERSAIERVFDTAGIVEVVQEFVNLKRAGVNFKGHCPFHEEKTPSFMVSPAKNMYKCFGCGKGGNPVNFIMEHEKLSFPDAIRFLAKKYQIEIEEVEQTPEQLEKKNERENLLVITNFAQKQFTDCLHNSDEGKNIGLSYFLHRGFRQDIILKFKLGYSPEKRNWLTELATKQGFKKDYLVQSGLTIDNERGPFDRFSGRVIFPILSLSGQVIGFGGRTLRKDKKTAKYLNSPESEIYHKSRELYGMYFARQEIIKKDKCFMVEGYTDVISFHQSGIENVVASSGTSLTSEQIRLLKRFTNNITIIFDGDEAGSKASLRGIDLVLEESLNVRVVLMPEGEDPDSFAKSRNSAELEKYIEENEQDFIHFKAELLKKDAGTDPVKRANMIADIVKSVALIPENLTRTVYVQECSRILDIGENVLFSEIAKLRNKRMGRDTAKQNYTRQNDSKAKQAEPETIRSRIHESVILRYLILYGKETLFKDEPDNQMPVYKYIYSELADDELLFDDPLCHRIFNEAIENYENKPEEDCEKYFIRHPDPEVSSFIVEIISDKYALSKIHSRLGNVIHAESEILDDLAPKAIHEYKIRMVQKMIMENQKDIEEASLKKDDDKIIELLTYHQQLKKIENELSVMLGDRTIL